jgi:hypothetical protein
MAFGTMKNYDDFLLEWFRKNKKHKLEVVQDELTNIDGMTQEDYEQLKRENIEIKNRSNFYIMAYNSTSSNINRKYYYEDRIVEYLEKSSILIYKMFKYCYENDHDKEFIDNQFEKLAQFYRKFFLSRKMKKSISSMDTVTYVLNRMDAKKKGEEISRNFYVELVRKPSGSLYSFYRDRSEVNRVADEYRDIDPFGEEDWMEN